jgi:hypothetical protein
MEKGALGSAGKGPLLGFGPLACPHHPRIFGDMLKVDPHPDYPPEDGRYLRGNDFSPVAVANSLTSIGIYLRKV